MEVSPLSRGRMFHSLSALLPGSLRFFHPPIPAIPLVRLTASYPSGENDGVSVFSLNNQMG